MATALALGAARVAAATAGSMCVYPATLAGSEDAWEVRWRAPGSNVVRQERFLDYGLSELKHFAMRMARGLLSTSTPPTLNLLLLLLRAFV